MKRKTTSSRLRHRLTLQEEVMTPDGAGGYARTWENVADIWSEIAPISGKERFFAGHIQAQCTHRITLRYRDDITAKHRLVFEERLFNIRSVMNRHEDNELLELLVEEGVAT